MLNLPTAIRQLGAATRALLLFTVVLGLAYPLAVTGAAQAFLRKPANGSMVEVGHQVVGSRLIGQPFPDMGDFHPRPSAAGAGYDGLASGGSNLGPENPALLALVEQRRTAVARENGVPPVDVPPDALLASGSGLDPDISPAYARLQVNRVARARGLDPAVVLALVEAHVSGRRLGFLGEPRVNVLELNLALRILRR